MFRFYQTTFRPSGFGGLEVAFWPLVPKFPGLHPAEAVGFLGRKNFQHAFLQKKIRRSHVVAFVVITYLS
jgi:hypothetical protein